MVLLNDTFVPELDHKAVLKLFQEVPVDSHTRFALVGTVTIVIFGHLKQS